MNPAARTSCSTPSRRSRGSTPGCRVSPGVGRGNALRSTRATRKPARAQVMAVAAPAGPPPRTATSVSNKQYPLAPVGLAPLLHQRPLVDRIDEQEIQLFDWDSFLEEVRRIDHW